jgi:hypothetical protein
MRAGSALLFLSPWPGGLRSLVTGLTNHHRSGRTEPFKRRRTRSPIQDDFHELITLKGLQEVLIQVLFTLSNQDDPSGSGFKRRA